MFLIEKGKFVVIRDNNDNEISFSTIEEFKKFYPEIGTFIDSKWYVDYEPNRYCHFIIIDNNTENIFKTNPFVQEYEQAIVNLQVIIDRKNNPYYNKTLEEAKAIAITDLKSNTRSYINQHMPDWKQFRWNQFMQIYEKVKKNETLTDLETAVYNDFPDTETGETAKSCYDDCQTAFNWNLICIKENNKAEKLIQKTTTIEEIKTIIPAYPVWPL